jgi:hypothetical protein
MHGNGDRPSRPDGNKDHTGNRSHSRLNTSKTTRPPHTKNPPKPTPKPTATQWVHRLETPSEHPPEAKHKSPAHRPPPLGCKCVENSSSAGGDDRVTAKSSGRAQRPNGRNKHTPQNQPDSTGSTPHIETREQRRERQGSGRRRQSTQKAVEQPETACRGTDAREEALPSRERP